MGTAYLSRELLDARDRLPLLVARGGGALSVPVPQLLEAPQVEQGAEAGAVVADHREVLVLDGAAHLGVTFNIILYEFQGFRKSE